MTRLQHVIQILEAAISQQREIRTLLKKIHDSLPKRTPKHIIDDFDRLLRYLDDHQ